MSHSLDWAVFSTAWLWSRARPSIFKFLSSFSLGFIFIPVYYLIAIIWALCGHLFVVRCHDHLTVLFLDIGYIEWQGDDFVLP